MIYHYYSNGRDRQNMKLIEEFKKISGNIKIIDKAEEKEIAEAEKDKLKPGEQEKIVEDAPVIKIDLLFVVIFLKR